MGRLDSSSDELEDSGNGQNDKESKADDKEEDNAGVETEAGIWACDPNKWSLLLDAWADDDGWEEKDWNTKEEMEGCKKGQHDSKTELPEVVLELRGCVLESSQPWGGSLSPKNPSLQSFGD